MKTTLLKLALGLTVAAMGAMPAGAGDYGGGLKGLRGSYVPVPAPNPVPDYKAKYYLRADLGVGFNIGSDLSESGARYGRNDAGLFNASRPFALGDPAFFNAFSTDGGHDVGYSFGVGAGYYITNNFRMDLTFDLREEKSPSLNGDFTYDNYVDTDADGIVDSPDGNEVSGTVRDRFRLRSGIFLANAYYDMSGFGRWRPYVGGGVGFSVNELERLHQTNYSLCGTPGCANPVSAGSVRESSDTRYTYSLAAQLTAGVSYQVWDNTHLDINYRYLFVGGTDQDMSLNGRNSTIEIDDQHEHYPVSYTHLRAHET